MTKPGGTLSDEFDSIYESIQQLMEDLGAYGTEQGKSAGIESLQVALERLTRSVSLVEMFSKNETYEEMDPKTLKFLLLPCFLGILWQQKRGVDRKDVWQIAEVYFIDFLERLTDTGIIATSPSILKLLNEYTAASEGGDGDSTAKAPGISSGNNNRQMKITRFKQSKELEKKIRTLSERKKESEDDPVVIQELYVSLLRKYALEAESELEAILAEKQLVSSHPNIESSQLPPGSSSVPKSSTLPYETFIITKSDIQKKTFGIGYPSIPVMTVEELYRDRVAKGIWAKPTTIDDTQVPQDDEANEVQEALEEADETRRAQHQAMDEYKDMHRRGWGNRMNRS